MKPILILMPIDYSYDWQVRILLERGSNVNQPDRKVPKSKPF